jgi:hypothetical protein
VASIALTVNEVLTASYRAIYGGKDEDELILRTSPLTATAEVQSLFQANIVDIESALPAALHSLGCSAEEIASALERRRALEKQETALKKQRDATETDELKARSKIAKQPVTADGGSSSGSSSGSSAAPKQPSKPQSDSGGDD